MYISLGRHCDIKYNLDLVRNKCETQFFDWLRSDFKTALHILKMNDIERELLYEDNLIINQFDKSNYGVTFKTLTELNLICLSHHDLIYKETLLIEDIKDFIDKYKRRFIRLINLIKSDKKIIFIHRDPNKTVEYDDYNEFKNILQKINPDVNFYLILLREHEYDYIFIKKDYLITINLNKCIQKDTSKDKWKMQKYNWNSIFNIIDEIIDNKFIG